MRAAEIAAGVVVNVALFDDGTTLPQGWVDTGGNLVGTGWLFDGSVFSPPPPPTSEELDALAEALTRETLESRAVDKTLAQFIMECVRSIKTGDVTFWASVTNKQTFRDLFLTKLREKL